MALIDARTGLEIADVGVPLLRLEQGERDSMPERVAAAVDRMILSASGWRTIFAADGSEDSAATEVPAELLVAAGLAANVFAAHVRAYAERPHVLVGIDTRPTGPLIARAALRALIATEVEAEYVFVAASPEIMAYAMAPGKDAFFYVSASHNPIGHNGLKMGGSDGGVIGGDAAADLISDFRRTVGSREAVAGMTALLAETASAAEVECLESVAAAKERCLAAYRAFSDDVVRGPGPRADEAYAAFRSAVTETAPGVLGDLNGSARAASIDGEYLRSTGCTVRLINDRAGRIAHQIVPEGAGLAPCREELERLVGEGEQFVLGYVPDNDGDRGNLVFYDAALRRARQLEAQEVFALACVAELAWIVYTGELGYGPGGRPSRRAAVVVNGPTSLRVDRIAERFGVEVHRAEVGEANVVSRARELRAQGVLVRILGEGSNGGNITFPSSVRDPLHTLHAVLKLLCAPATDWSPSPASIWLGRSNAGTDADQASPITLTALLDSLPEFTTTSAFEERAIMRIGSTSHRELKERFERLLAPAAEELLGRVRSELGVSRYSVVNYERTTVREGAGNRTGEERGGLKVLLHDADGTARAFAWMRGSGTEPVFRIMADVEGRRPETEALVLDWIRRLVERADS